jgi:DNA repair exonuclease SbcCD ATPase subunit
MDDENDISLHYARMMRTLDAGHRQALHAKDRQISELREKLNEKDIVLRQQLRAKDFIIDDLKKRLDNLEENVEAMLERARNSVEDLWEARWKDRDFHLRERMRRIEDEAQGLRARAGSGSPT